MDDYSDNYDDIINSNLNSFGDNMDLLADLASKGDNRNKYLSFIGSGDQLLNKILSSYESKHEDEQKHEKRELLEQLLDKMETPEEPKPAFKNADIMERVIKRKKELDALGSEDTFWEEFDEDEMADILIDSLVSTKEAKEEFETRLHDRILDSIEPAIEDADLSSEDLEKLKEIIIKIKIEPIKGPEDPNIGGNSI